MAGPFLSVSPPNVNLGDALSGAVFVLMSPQRTGLSVTAASATLARQLVTRGVCRVAAPQSSSFLGSSLSVASIDDVTIVAAGSPVRNGVYMIQVCPFFEMLFMQSPARIRLYGSLPFITPCAYCYAVVYDWLRLIDLPSLLVRSVSPDCETPSASFVPVNRLAQFPSAPPSRQRPTRRARSWTASLASR